MPEEEGEEKPEVMLHLYPVLAPDKIAQSFLSAVHLDAKNALYWQGLGDFLIHHGKTASKQDEKDEKAPSKDSPPTADEAYRESLRLKPRQPTLWYRLYRTASPDTPEQKAQALADLQKAGEYDPGNSWYAYDEAYVRMRQAPYSSYALYSQTSDPDLKGMLPQAREGLNQPEARAVIKEVRAVITRADRATGFKRPVYREAVPRWMAAGWEQFLLSAEYAQFDYFTRFRELGRALIGYALFVAKEENNLEEAEWACRATIRLGLRLVGDWPVHSRSFFDSGFGDAMTGHSIIRSGYQTLLRILREGGATERLNQLQSEYDTYSEREKAHRTAMREAMAKESMWQLY